MFTFSAVCLLFQQLFIYIFSCLFYQKVVAHCGKIPIFVQKIKLSKIPFLAGKFKFNVGVDFINIDFLNKNPNFATVCLLSTDASHSERNEASKINFSWFQKIVESWEKLWNFFCWFRCPKFHLDNIFIGEKAVSDEVTKFIFKRAFSFSDALCWIEWLMRQGG